MHTRSICNAKRHHYFVLNSTRNTKHFCSTHNWLYWKNSAKKQTFCASVQTWHHMTWKIWS